MSKQIENKYDTAKKMYPILKNYPYNIVETLDENSPYYLEHFSPEEVGSLENPRPKNLPIGEYGLQIFKDVRPEDIAGDIISHHVINKDKYLSKKYEEFKKLISKEDMLNRYNYHKNNLGEKRDFNNWSERTGYPELLRGYVFNQFDKKTKDNLYTLEQKKVLDSIKNYITQNEKILQAFYKGGLAKYMETEKQTEEAFNLSDFFKETFKLQEPPAIKFGRELKEEFKNLTGTNTKDKGMSYPDLIFDSIPFSNVGDPDEEYETSMETLYKAFKDNPKDFLKQLITGIGDNLGINRPSYLFGVPSAFLTTTPLKEDALLENPYGYGKEFVTDIATNIYDLFTKTEDMRAQQIYDKPFKNLTGEEQNKIRESILGNIMTMAGVVSSGGYTYGAARRAIKENIANQNIDHSPNAYTSSPNTTKTISTFDKDKIVEKEVNTNYISPWKIETEDSIFTFNSNPINKNLEKNIDFNKGVFTFSPTIEALNNFPNYSTLKNKQLIAPSSLWTHLTNSKINNKMVLKSAGGEKVFAQKALDFYVEQNIIDSKLVKNIDFDSDSPKEIAKIYELIESSLYKFNQATKKAKAFPFLDDPNDVKYEVDLGHTKKYFSSAEDLESYIQITNNDFFNTINKALVSTALGGRSVVFTVDSYKNPPPVFNINDPVMGGSGYDPALSLDQLTKADVLRLSKSPVFNTDFVPFF